MDAFIHTIISVLRTFWITDFVDIILVAFLIYKAVQLIRETRAEQLIKGILLLVVAYYLSLVIGLKALSYILANIFQFGVIALVVVFQPELRSVLEHVGRSGVSRLKFLKQDNSSNTADKTKAYIASVCVAVARFQKDRTGALILFERKTRLGEIIKTGTIVNADVSPEIIGNIFFNKAPLHDGAMIIRDGRVYAAGCFLPLSQNQDISRELGTRHRAALGISESCDVLVVVVSEETGVISLVQNGVLKRNLTVENLQEALEKGLLAEEIIDKKPKKAGKKVDSHEK